MKIILILAITFCLQFDAIGQRTGNFDRKRPVKTKQERKVWTEEEAICWLKEEDYYARLFVVRDSFFDCLENYGETLASLENPDRIIRAFLDFPSDNDEVRGGLIWILTPYRSHDGVEDFIDSLVSLGGVRTQTSAAQAYLRWQAWEKACSLITECEEYNAFYIIRDDRVLFDSMAVPFLRKACREASWGGRSFAAYVLQNTGDTMTYKDVAIDIIRNSPLIADENVENAQRSALNVIQRCNIEIISDVARLADSEGQYVSNFTVSVLDHFMHKGNEDARIALEKIAEENEDAELSAMAKEKLLLYEEGLK